MYEQRDTSVPRKHQADYRYKGNRGTAKTRNIHRVVYSSNTMCIYSPHSTMSKLDIFLAIALFLTAQARVTMANWKLKPGKHWLNCGAGLSHAYSVS